MTTTDERIIERRVPATPSAEGSRTRADASAVTIAVAAGEERHRGPRDAASDYHALRKMISSV